MRLIWNKNKLQTLNLEDYEVACNSLFLGNGLFETTRFGNGRIYFLIEHLDRLKFSIKTIYKIDLQIDIVRLKSSLNELEITELSRLKIIWVPSLITNLIIEIIPFKDNLTPKKLLSDDFFTVSNNPYRSLKKISYFSNLMLNKRAQELYFDDYLIKDVSGNILETTIANIFFIEDTQSGLRVLTPYDNNILKGTIRQKIIDNLYEELKIPVIVKNITMNELSNFCGCFITNSLRFIIEIISINNIFFTTPLNCKLLIANIYKMLKSK